MSEIDLDDDVTAAAAEMTRNEVTAFDAWRTCGGSGNLSEDGDISFFPKAECNWIGLTGWRHLEEIGLVTLDTSDGQITPSATSLGRRVLAILSGDDYGEIYRAAKRESK